jgi:hypothetical protein
MCFTITFFCFGLGTLRITIDRLLLRKKQFATIRRLPAARVTPP